MKIRDIQARVLQELYTLYQDKGFNWGSELHEIEQRIPGTRPGAVEEVLGAFRDAGLVDYDETLNTLHGIHLTTHGVELIEDEGTEEHDLVVHQVNVHGGNVQFGNNNQQTITYNAVLRSLVEQIEGAPDVPPDQKKRWATTLRELAAHPLTQTVLGALAGAGTTAAFK
jgi:hypothetical protein